MSHKKFGPDRFSRFEIIGYKQTNKQTNTQTDKPNLYIDLEQNHKGGETPPLTVIGLIKIVFLSKIIMIC